MTQTKTQRDPTIQEMLDDAKNLYTAQVKVAKALEKLPNDAARRRVLRAVAILLGFEPVESIQAGRTFEVER